MQENKETNKDNFGLKLEEASENLKKCQKDHNLESCFNCEHFFECKIRLTYVNAVFSNMSKGLNTDFNF